jgi:hypothetical protein
VRRAERRSIKILREVWRTPAFGCRFAGTVIGPTHTASHDESSRLGSIGSSGNGGVGGIEIAGGTARSAPASNPFRAIGSSGNHCVGAVRPCRGAFSSSSSCSGTATFGYGRADDLASGDSVRLFIGVFFDALYWTVPVGP